MVAIHYLAAKKMAKIGCIATLIVTLSALIAVEDTDQQLQLLYTIP